MKHNIQKWIDFVNDKVEDVFVEYPPDCTSCSNYDVCQIEIVYFGGEVVNTTRGLCAYTRRKK